MVWPRMYISEKTHKRVKKIAKEKKTTLKAISDKIVIAGCRALGY